MNVNPMTCKSQEQFSMICRPLGKLDKKDLSKHLVLSEENQGCYFPIPGSKKYKHLSTQNAYYKCDEKFLLTFFEVNKKWAVKERSCIKIVLRRLNKTHSEASTLGKCDKLLKELKVLKNQKRELAYRERYIEEEKGFWDKKIQKQILKLAALNDQSEQIQEEIYYLEKNKDRMKDLLILCANGKKIFVHSQLFKSIPFLLSGESSKRKADEFLSDKEIKNFPNITKTLDLRGYSDEAIATFIYYLKQDKAINQIVNPNILFEIYDLANSIHYISLKIACLNQLKIRATNQDLLSVLCNKNYDPKDGLIQYACQRSAENYNEIPSSDISRINREYMKEIMGREFVPVRGRYLSDASQVNYNA